MALSFSKPFNQQIDASEVGVCVSYTIIVSYTSVNLNPAQETDSAF